MKKQLKDLIDLLQSSIDDCIDDLEAISNSEKVESEQEPYAYEIIGPDCEPHGFTKKPSEYDIEGGCIFIPLYCGPPEKTQGWIPVSIFPEDRKWILTYNEEHDQYDVDYFIDDEEHREKLSFWADYWMYRPIFNPPTNK